MTIEKYLKMRDKGLSLENVMWEHSLSEATAYTLELGYQCYLKKLPLDMAIKLIQEETVL